MSDDEDLFASSGEDTDDLIAASKQAPIAKKKKKAPKRLQKKSAPKKKKNKAAAAASVPEADGDDDEDEGAGLFDDSDDEDEAPKKTLSKRERMEALKAKRLQQEGETAGEALTKDDKGYGSGDSYDSADYERTKEDNDFIDVDDDDPDALKELYAEQHFADERPDGMEEEKGKKRKTSKGAASRKRPGGPDSVSDEEGDGEPENPIMAAVHRMKKKKRVAKKLGELEEEAKELIEKMDLAASQDELAVSERRPATKKLALLPEVLDMLARQDLMRILLDFEVLTVCRRWIQPLPSGALGNVTVRQRLIDAISTMTGEQGITSNHLKRSEFGKVVMTLYKHPSETPAMKKKLKGLIEQWSRPIFSKSSNMKELEHVQAYRREAGVVGGPSMARAAAAPEDAGGERDLQSIIATGTKGASKEGLNRVQVPFSKGFAFTVRPESRKGDVGDKRLARSSGGKDTRGNLSKRMLEKGRVASKNQRSANMSIEGRPTK